MVKKSKHIEIKKGGDIDNQYTDDSQNPPICGSSSVLCYVIKFGLFFFLGMKTVGTWTWLLLLLVDV